MLFGLDNLAFLDSIQNVAPAVFALFMNEAYTSAHRIVLTDRMIYIPNDQTSVSNMDDDACH